jgi:2-aminoadipate transaminase
MLDSLERFFPGEATWTRPDGGLFLWVTLPEGMNCHELFHEAIENKVAFVPGSSFFTDEGEGTRNLRLNFSSNTPERITEGIRRLSEAVKAQLQTTQLVSTTF